MISCPRCGSNNIEKAMTPNMAVCVLGSALWFAGLFIPLFLLLAVPLFLFGLISWIFDSFKQKKPQNDWHCKVCGEIFQYDLPKTKQNETKSNNDWPDNAPHL